MSKSKEIVCWVALSGNYQGDPWDLGDVRLFTNKAAAEAYVKMSPLGGGVFKRKVRSELSEDLVEMLKSWIARLGPPKKGHAWVPPGLDFDECEPEQD